MNATKLFVTYMKREHEVEVNVADVFWESVTLYHDEIDENLFPVKELIGLPDPLLISTTDFLDEHEHEWIFCIVTENDNAHNWLHAVCIKEGVLINDNVPLNLN